MPLPITHATAYVVYGDDVKSPFVNVLYYYLETNATLSNTDAEALASVIDLDVGPKLVACLPNDATYHHVTVKINNDGLAYEALDGASSDVGALADDSLPQGVAVVIRKRTAVPGRRGRGRWYVGCISEDDNDSGKLEPAAQTRWEALAAAMAVDRTIGANVWKACHYSRADDTMVPIVNTIVQRNFGRQGRRSLQPTF